MTAFRRPPSSGRAFDFREVGPAIVSGASNACLNDWVDVSGEDMAEERDPRRCENNADKSSEANDPRLLFPPRELLDRNPRL